jgi:hypothetical protein
MSRCAFIKAGGERCKARAQEGYDHCFNHRSDTAELRKEAARSGGKARARGGPYSDLRAAKRSLSKLRQEIWRGNMSPQRGAVLTQVINAEIRCVEVERKVREQEELEARIAALESTKARGIWGA